ncbi:DUF11 domain-containing protein, partial [Methanobrevibacter millerae]|uniref:DUF11 domain-containing protein n=1 Tax=Methanobrevibacter millerae TaxID=230361 RepID=UPI00122C4BC1
LTLKEVEFLSVCFNTTQAGNFTNVVVAGSNETDNKTANNTTTVLTPDLSVEKITITPVVKIGDQVTFEIIVRNTGETKLTNVFVEETSYNGLIYDSFVDNGLWNHSLINGKNVWKLNNELGLKGVVGLFVKFNTTVKGNFTNVVVAGSDETDNKTSNNTTTVLEPGLDVSKITLTPAVNIGNKVSFEIIVRNTGETNLTNVFVEEFSYTGLTYDSFVDNGLWTHSFVNGKNVWTLNRNLSVNEVVSLFVIFNTTVKGNFTNVVVAGSNETDNKTSNNTTTVLVPDFTLEKVTLTPAVKIGDQVKFEIIVKNTGEAELTNVFVEESSYTGLTYDSFVDNGLWSHSLINGKNVWTLNRNLSVNEVVSLFVNFNTTVKGNFTNVVVGGSNETENKTTNNTTTVLEPGLDVSKITITPAVNIGNQVKFEIIVRNTGEAELTNVFVEESSYTGLIYDSFVDNGLWAHSLINGKNVWILNKNLTVNDVVSLFVNFNTTVKGNFTNVVVAGSNETDNKTTNNTTTVLVPDFTVEKVTLTPAVKIGNQVKFEIIVRNTGEAELTNVFVEESFYNGLIYDSFVDNGLWSHSVVNGKNVWTLNRNLSVNGVVSLFVNFNTTVKGNFTNVVVAGSNETENKTTNNTTTVLTPDLDVSKVTLTPAVQVGNQTSFEIIVKNTGKVELTNVFIEETSYNGLTYDSFVDNGIWTHSLINGKNVWTLNMDLDVNEVVLLIVKFNTTAVGNFTNIVTVGSTETENKTANNNTTVYNDTVPVVPKNPGIDIEKIALKDIVILGSQARFEIVVRNTGDTILNDVVVSEDSFDGLIYDSFVDYNGLWIKNNDLSWTLNAPLYVGETFTLYVLFNTTAAGEFTNVVTVDTNETENKTTNDTVKVVKPDFSVEKVALEDVVIVGNQVTFEIVVRNTGEVALTDVVVEESSYTGLVYDSFVDYNGLWIKNNDLSWTLNAPLYVGEIATFYAVFNTTATGQFMNVVTVDTNETGNKSANDTVNVVKPD